MRGDKAPAQLPSFLRLPLQSIRIDSRYEQRDWYFPIMESLSIHLDDRIDSNSYLLSVLTL